MIKVSESKELPNDATRLSSARTFDEKTALKQVLDGETQRRILRTAKDSDQKFTMEDFWIMKGWHDENGLTLAQWQYDTGSPREAVRFLVEKVLEKDPRDVTRADFYNNKLRSIIHNKRRGAQAHYANVYAAVADAFPEENIKPWQMRTPRHNVWIKEQNRVGAIKELIAGLERELKIPIEKIVRETTFFETIEKRYRGLLEYVDIYTAINESFPELNLKPWDLKQAGNGTWKIRQNRIDATRELIGKLGKELTEISQSDFRENGFGGVLDVHNGIPYLAIAEAYPEKNIRPWHMKGIPNGTWNIKKNRIQATKELMSSSTKDIHDFTVDDFVNKRMRGLFTYHNSVYSVLKEAGFVEETYEEYMDIRKLMRGEHQ